MIIIIIIIISLYHYIIITTIITININITIRARAVAYFYLLAFLCLAVAQMFLGYVYFPTSCGSASETCQNVSSTLIARNNATNDTICWDSEALKLAGCTPTPYAGCWDSEALKLAGCTSTPCAMVPFVGGVVMLAGILLLFVKIAVGFYNSGGVLVDAHGRAVGNEINKNGSVVKRSESSDSSRSSRQLELMTKRELGIRMSWSNQVSNPARKSLVDAATTSKVDEKVEERVEEKVDGPCHSAANRRQHRPERMYNMIHPIADQATFVASFSLAAQTRLLANIEGSNFTLNFFYIVFMTVCTVSSVLSSLGLSFIDMMLVDMRNGGIAGINEQNRFLDAVSSIVHGCFLLFAVACVSFLSGFCVMAWGVGYVDKDVSFSLTFVFTHLFLMIEEVGTLFACFSLTLIILSITPSLLLRCL